MRGPKDFRLENGTVIDHLPVGTAARAARMLKLPRGGAVTVGLNVSSDRYRSKDIIRIEGLELSKDELDRLALLGERITVSLVRDGDVDHKVVLETPLLVEAIFTCRNPTCITNHEEITTRFHRIGDYPYRFRCHHCERVRTLDE